jgi:hypothetical protein
MRTSFLSEVKNSFRRLLVLAKVEKYIHVSNQWLLINSEKAVEQAHRVTQQVQQIELEKYLNTGKEWLLDTPERALNHAYDAALILKKIEDKHFAGNPITSISNYNDGVSDYFRLVSKKYLLLIQIRLLEFQASHVIIDVQSFNQQILENNDEPGSILDKLKFIDEVLTRYQDQPTKRSTPINRSDVMTGPAIDLSEQEIYIQPEHQWKLLELLHQNFGKSNNSQYPQATTTVEMPSQTSQLRSRAVGNRGTYIGLTSLLFAGGLAIGGAASWFLLSSSDHPADGSKHLNSTEVHPDRTQTEATHSQVADRLSPPETLPLESSAAAIRSGETTKQQAASYRSPEAVPGDRVSGKRGSAQAIGTPSAPETMQLERRTPVRQEKTDKETTGEETPETMQLERRTPVQTAPAPRTPVHPKPAKQTTQPPASKLAPLSTQPTAPEPAAVALSGMTQQRRLTQADLQDRTAWELTVMRNEIYARHGRQFYEPELKRHFERQSWYQPQYPPEEFPVSLLSEIEMYNAVLIRDYQNTRGLWQH